MDSIFLHVPKAAGCATRGFLARLGMLDAARASVFPQGKFYCIHRLPWKNFAKKTNRYTAWDILKKRSQIDLPKFAFVRNPWDRFVSCFFYFKGMTETHPHYKYNISAINKVNSFRNFEDFCRSFSLDDAPQFHFLPQVNWTHNNGKSIVDYLGRFETLEQDLFFLKDKLGLSGDVKVTVSNASVHKKYTEYYSDYSRSLIEEIYQDDIKAFDYTFK